MVAARRVSPAIAGLAKQCNAAAAAHEQPNVEIILTRVLSSELREIGVLVNQPIPRFGETRLEELHQRGHYDQPLRHVYRRHEFQVRVEIPWHDVAQHVGRGEPDSFNGRDHGCNDCLLDVVVIGGIFLAVPRPELEDAAIFRSSSIPTRVSIRTRHCCRVMHRVTPRRSPGLEFQSAPGIAAG